MRMMILFVECGVGTKSADAVLVPEDMFDELGMETTELSAILWDYALNHAESFGIYPKSNKPDDWDEEEHDSWHDDQYSDDIASWLEPYDPDEHDCYLCGDATEWDWREI